MRRATDPTNLHSVTDLFRIVHSPHLLFTKLIGHVASIGTDYQLVIGY
jgi:hypothetical protein